MSVHGGPTATTETSNFIAGMQLATEATDEQLEVTPGPSASAAMTAATEYKRGLSRSEGEAEGFTGGGGPKMGSCRSAVQGAISYCGRGGWGPSAGGPPASAV